MSGDGTYFKKFRHSKELISEHSFQPNEKGSIFGLVVMRRNITNRGNALKDATRRGRDKKRKIPR